MACPNGCVRTGDICQATGCATASRVGMFVALYAPDADHEPTTDCTRVMWLHLYKCPAKSSYITAENLGKNLATSRVRFVAHVPVRYVSTRQSHLVFYSLA